ncbi:unnamed protein product [Leptidea sinapis]|uniref:Peptidase S1 domain-containing protein n=1 Tax=Leptidea sinapis TaxID=189913 RepID=A0A5E4PRI0_9NEOP|nr:unnamed protein product [Leptidea sinapis]
MKILLVVVGLLAATNAREIKHDIVTDYHNVIGIPLAEKIKQSESAMDFDGSRIIGGSAAGLGAHPHLGGLVIRLTTGATSVCGSSLLSNTRLVTAAHCWRTSRAQANQFTVVLGSTFLFSGGTRIVTNQVEMHASYNMNNLNNDIAIIRINPVTYSNIIARINMATGSNQFVGTWATAAGFGATSDSQQGIPSNTSKRQVNMMVIANNACERYYASNIVIASTICTDTARGTASTCGGDSGGPLSASNRLIGITSFGSARGCQSGAPAGFARVTSFAAWMNARL